MPCCVCCVLLKWNACSALLCSAKLYSRAWPSAMDYGLRMLDAGCRCIRELESELVNAAEVNPEVRGQRGYRASGSSVSIIGRRSFLSVSRLFSLPTKSLTSYR